MSYEKRVFRFFAPPLPHEKSLSHHVTFFDDHFFQEAPQATVGSLLDGTHESLGGLAWKAQSIVLCSNKWKNSVCVHSLALAMVKQNPSKLFSNASKGGTVNYLKVKENFKSPEVPTVHFPDWASRKFLCSEKNFLAKILFLHQIDLHESCKKVFKTQHLSQKRSVH